MKADYLMTKYTLDQALARIDELEKECAELKAKLEVFEKREPVGRRKHDAKWHESYDYFVDLYSNGLTIAEIVEKSDFSRRTAYRYKEYYDRMNSNKQGM